jgi:cyclohexanecarboxylate-CoA ligase
VRATWVPATARRFARPGGPWDGPDLDRLLSSRRPEWVDGRRRLGSDAIEDLTARLAGGLREKGVRRGRPVTWRVPNSLAAALLYRACWRIGAVAAPVLHTSGQADTRAAIGQLPDPYQVELDDEDASDPDALLAALGGRRVKTGAIGPARPSDLAAIIFTSGSSGTPKAVLHTHRALSYKARLMVGVHGLGDSDAVLMPAPLAHVSGLLNGVLVPGAASMRTVLVRRFDAAEALALLDDERVTFMVGPPTFFVAMTGAAPQGSLTGSTLRLVSSGGAAVTPAFVEATSAAFGCRVKRTYGSTEAPTVTTSRDDDPVERARDTEGRAVGEAELRISHPETGRRRAAGRPGELWLRGPELFAGYADPAAHAEVLARGGWFRTGDLATVDAEGWLTIVGRVKDVIIRGGENISAAEVEGVLEAHPDVRQAVAVGYPDELMGERVAAFVVADDGFDLEACRRWFTERGTARFKTPERVVRLDRLPLLGSGKPDRAALRELARAAASAG